MLIPLFGLQMFLTIYRPPVGTTGEREYEYVTFVIINAQVSVVAYFNNISTKRKIISHEFFCFFNWDVYNSND